MSAGMEWEDGVDNFYGCIYVSFMLIYCVHGHEILGQEDRVGGIGEASLPIWETHNGEYFILNVVDSPAHFLCFHFCCEDLPTHQLSASFLLSWWTGQVAQTQR